MKKMADNQFDLAIVDPPYGIGFDNKIRDKKSKNWDNEAPKDRYFIELQRVSKNQIIWGGNYYYYAWNGLADGIRGRNKKTKTIHPTQKPVKLYEWLLINYAKEGDEILDTHLGSASIAIACYNLDYELTGYELDKEYFDRACKRIDQQTKQTQLW
jgi:site-specific DNA-methyltransferase (adenine-specific)